MNQKLHDRRSSAEPSPTKTGAIPLGSDSGCDVSSQNRNRMRSWVGLEKCSEAERRIITARFWAHVKKTDGCWPWTWSAQKLRGGHGQLRCTTGGRVYLLKTHRLAWEIAYGAIPDALQINHRCENAICCRPEHLYLGSQQENLNDARRSGRLNERLPRTSTLTLADRLAIYHMPERRGLRMELALRYGITEAAISRIRAGHFVGSPFDQVFQRVPSRPVSVRGEVA